MKIESIIKRPGGSQVKLGAIAYHFKPDELDRHVADVENPDHAKVLLGITEGFRSLDPVVEVDVSLEAAIGVIKAKFPDKNIEGFLYADEAQQAAPVTQTIPGDDSKVDAQKDAQAADQGATDEKAGLSALTDEQLRAEFEKLIGRKPHANMLRENMEAQITAARAEAGQ